MVKNSLDDLSGIGPKTRGKLAHLSINNLTDLIYHFPHRYIDFSHTIPIAKSYPNENVTIKGTLLDFKNIYTATHKNLQIATIKDLSGSILMMWFNQPYLTSTFKIGNTYSFAGTVSFYQKKLCIFSPEYGQYSTGKIIAVYPETAGLSSKWFRKIIQTNINNFVINTKEYLPKKIILKHKLLDIKSALAQIHLPSSQELLEKARLRLSIDEILAIQTTSYLKKKKWLELKPEIPLKNTPAFQKIINNFIASLPFKLTSDQNKVWQEILADLTSTSKITNRLLQGDVGSGKTIIAILASILTSINHRQTIVIAPTEILAKQHYQTFKSALDIPVHLLTSKNKINFEDLSSNSILITTHAIFFQKKKITDKLGLLIIDEQHRFGVKQRNFLSHLTSPPHTITMTATPIPRTVSLTLLGNLDISTIDTLPKNRLPVKTFLVPNHKKGDCHLWIKQHLKNTYSQAFIVCPFIEESETMASIKAASKEFKNLQKTYPEFKLALIHSKIPQSEQEKIINNFQKNLINILVTTPIIEVGIDIPNASIIIIESADRFGLAQLHQLRGRVGRSDQQSYCYLFTESENEKTLERLKFLQNNHHGLELAQYDLATRGPGEMFSTVQHGFPSLKIADLSNLKLIEFSQKILYDLIKEPKFNLQKLTKINSDNLTTN